MYGAPATAHSVGPASAALYVQTFGGFRLYRAGCPVPAAGWRRQSAKYLLVRLLLADGRPVPKPDLLGTFWPEIPEAAAANRLRVTLHALRRVLQPGLPAHRPSAYLVVNRHECSLPAHPDLRWDGGDLDRGVVRAAAAPEPRAEATALHHALAGVAGPWLPEVDAFGVFVSARFRLHQQATEAALRLAELSLDHGAPADAEAAAARAIAVDPGIEQAYALLLRAAGATGRPGRVRRAYDYSCTQLREHADVEPGPALRRAAEEALTAAGSGLGRPGAFYTVGAPPASLPAGRRPSGTVLGASEANSPAAAKESRARTR